MVVVSVLGCMVISLHSSVPECIVCLWKRVHKHILIALMFRDIISQAGDDSFVEAYRLSTTLWMTGCCCGILDSYLSTD